MNNDDTFWGKLALIILFCFIALYGSYHIGRYHQRTSYTEQNCEPSLICKPTKQGLECIRKAL